MSKTIPSFALAAAVTILFNTVLACVKDAYAPLNTFMNSLLGHNWTTHGVVDLLLFAALGFLFTKANIQIDSDRATSILIWSVAVASFGLFFWYALT